MTYPRLQQFLDNLSDDLLHTPYGELSSEETTTDLWNIYILQLIRYAVRDIDQNPTLPVKPLTTPTLYSETRDFLISSTQDTSPCLYYDIKSWSVFDAFALDILSLAQHVEDGQLGTSLELRVNEEDARSVIMNVSENYFIFKITFNSLVLLDGCFRDWRRKYDTLRYSFWRPQVYVLLVVL